MDRDSWESSSSGFRDGDSEETQLPGGEAVLNPGASEARLSETPSSHQETSDADVAVQGLTLPRVRARPSGDEVMPSPIDVLERRTPSPSARADGPTSAPRPQGEASDSGRAATMETRAFDPDGAHTFAPQPLDIANPASRRGLPPLPEVMAGVSPGAMLWFMASFVLPVLLGTIYFMFIASNQYEVDMRFTVRTPDTAASANNNNTLSLLTGSGQIGTVDQNNSFMIDDYMRSPQAARDLDARLNIRKMFSSKKIDLISRLKNDASDDDLGKYWNNMSYSLSDPSTGLNIVKVRAFTPQDAYLIAQTLLKLSGQVVNSLGERSRLDSVHMAETDVERQRKELADLTAQMTTLRNSSNVVDPMTNTVASNITLATTLRATVAQIQSQMNSLSQQLRNPNAPQIAPLKAQLSATQAQLSAVDGQIARAEGNDPSLSGVVGKFEKLTTLRNAVETALATSVANLQANQENNDSQRIYIAPYVWPAVPTHSNYPDRLVSSAIVALACLLIWVLGLLLANSLIEHS
jgi:capsular polysaccharide transport system permease protein